MATYFQQYLEFKLQRKVTPVVLQHLIRMTNPETPRRWLHGTLQPNTENRIALSGRLRCELREIEHVLSIDLVDDSVKELLWKRLLETIEKTPKTINTRL